MLDLEPIRARYDIWADPPADPGDLDDTEIDALWKSANDVPRLLAEVEQRDAELRAARELAEAATPMVEWLRPLHGRTAKAHESPCAACRFVAAWDKVAGEADADA